MKIAVIGTGYVGLTTGVCLAEIGHEVICVDIDQNKIKSLSQGKCPIYEPGLEKLIKKNLKKGRLHFTIESKKAIYGAKVVFSAVGTPPDKDHRADLKYVKQVAKTFAKNLSSYKLFVNKSTVPVGTAEVCRKIIEKEAKNKNFDVISNPEFLREGTAVQDTLNPNRIVVGVESAKAKKLIQKIYKPYSDKQIPILYTDLKTAEIIKYASNAFLATKISFINEIANFCEKAGGNVQEIAKGMGYDQRIGKNFLKAGIGYGGSCFPKDVQALIQTGKDFGYEFTIIKSTEEVNNKQKISLIPKLKKLIPSLKGKTIALWGLSFKPETDDMRDAPSIDVIKELSKLGCKIQAYDPAAIKNAEKIFPPSAKIKYFESAATATKSAHALLLLTEWPEFKKQNLKKIKASMKTPIILDGRNFLNL